MRGLHRPQNTLIVAPTVIIGTLEPMFYLILLYQIIQFLGSAEPHISGSVIFFVNLYKG